MLRHTLLLFLLLIQAASYGQEYSLQYIDTKTDASFRGLSVGAYNAIWVSGSKGWVGRSANGGQDWTFRQVPGYETLDFRTLYATDSNNAIIANAGSPAYILRTTDGGATWKQVYENTDSAAFIDGIGFWNNKHGIIHGDPIDGHMLLLYTKNGGKTWKERRNSPALGKGEASFAASGTVINCFPPGSVVIAVGGKMSKLYASGNRGRSWGSTPTPMLSGRASTGIFSIMRGSADEHWFIAGGDYTNDTVRTANFFYSTDGWQTWHAPETTTRGYRECLAQVTVGTKKLPEKIMFAVGPSGIDISTDRGVNWKPLSDDKGFHVIKPSKDHNHMFLAGSNGKLAIMTTTQ